MLWYIGILSSSQFYIFKVGCKLCMKQLAVLLGSIANLVHSNLDIYGDPDLMGASAELWPKDKATVPRGKGSAKRPRCDSHLRMGIACADQTKSQVKGSNEKSVAGAARATVLKYQKERMAVIQVLGKSEFAHPGRGSKISFYFQNYLFAFISFCVQ